MAVAVDLTKLADTEDDNAEVWEGLPGFQWYAPVLRAKAGSDVLCVHKDASNEFGRLPLLVTRTMGAGKVLFMGTDGAWRWRKGVEDKYHYRFWGQVVRWMAYQRNMAKGETMRLYYVPDQPKLHQMVALHTNVMDKSGEPLHGGEVTARITAPSGKSELVRFTSAGDEWGEFSGRFMADEAGTHRVSLFCKETGATLDASFFVQGVAIEPVGKPARPEVHGGARSRDGRQGLGGRQARSSGPGAGRAPRSAPPGAPAAALVPPGGGGNTCYTFRRLLGGTEGDWSSIIVGSTSETPRTFFAEVAMSMAYSPDRLRLPDSLEQQMHQFRRRVWWIKMVEAVAAAAFGTLIAYLVLFALDRVWDTPGWLRVVLFIGAAVACANIPIALHRWVWRHRRLEQLARLLARKHPRVGDQLLGIIELVRNEFEQARSRTLCEAAIREVAQDARRRDFTDAVPNPRHRFWAYLAAAPLALAIVLFGLFPAAAANAWQRFLSPWNSAPRYTFTMLENLPAKIVVPHGEPFTVPLGA